MPDYTLAELSPEDAANLTRELQEVLAKYDAEMGVASQINLMQRVPKEEGTPSFLTKEDLDNGDNTDSKTEEGS